MAQPATPSSASRWTLRDLLAAAALFVATAAVVLWQNSHLAVLWDISYILDSSFRIALGQLPYRDFPLAHAPLTFLIQASIIRLTGRVFFHHVLYVATVAGSSTVVTWRIALHTLQARLAAAWITSLLLAIPLTVLGIYTIYPHPNYDCDCIFSVLIAVLLLQRLLSPSPRATSHAIAAGAAMVVPLFFKQNIGLPFLLAAGGGIVLLLAVRLLFPRTTAANPSTRTLLAVLVAASTILLAALLLLHVTVGIGNYLHWTVKFAGQRRLPGFRDMLGVYAEPSLLWTLPCVAVALLLLNTRFAGRPRTRLFALALLAAAFLRTLLSLFLTKDPDDRASSLLALWPLILILSVILVLYNLRRGLNLGVLLPIAILAAIHGTLLSQQLWGSTYAIWPLFVLLLAQMIAYLAPGELPAGQAATASQPTVYIPALAPVIAITLLVCGGFYTASDERLSYADLSTGPLLHSNLPQLAGMSIRGPYLPAFEQLVRFAATDIPASDGLIFINGEDPFYFTTGRIPQFPVLLFDPASDPYSPAQIVDEARTRNIRWLIVKRNPQIKEDPTHQNEATISLLKRDFALYRRLDNYDVYRRP